MATADTQNSPTSEELAFHEQLQLLERLWVFPVKRQNQLSELFRLIHDRQSPSVSFSTEAAESAQLS